MWQDYLSKSKANLDAAIRDVDFKDCDPCVSRAYFAAFQAAIAALLALTDFQRRGKYWDHGEISAEFARRLIHRRKVFPRLMVNTLDDLKTRRHQADYDTRRTSRKVAQRSLSKSRQFVEQVESALQKLRST